MSKTAIKRLNTRSYFLLQFSGIYLVFLLSGFATNLESISGIELIAFVHHFRNVALVLFPFSIYLAFPANFSSLIEHSIMAILAVLTGLILGSKDEVAWGLIVKIAGYLVMSYWIFCLSSCCFLGIAPEFPPPLSIWTMLELAAGK